MLSVNNNEGRGGGTIFPSSLDFDRSIYRTAAETLRFKQQGHVLAVGGSIEVVVDDVQHGIGGSTEAVVGNVPATLKSVTMSYMYTRVPRLC